LNRWRTVEAGAEVPRRLRCARHVNQIGGGDTELKSIVLQELTEAGIPARISTNPKLDGSDPFNICNRTKSGAGVQLEMGTTFRASLFAPGCNTRELRKNNTNAEFS
jgi:phage replication-related protein YjqB (UPF0714/DUF867 family)